MPSCTNVAFCILLVFGAECARSEQTGTLLERANSSYLASRHEEAVELIVHISRNILTARTSAFFLAPAC